MERGLVMLLHSALVGVVLYVSMVYLLNQDKKVSEDMSVLLGGVVLVYMVLFGHGLPTQLNKNVQSVLTTLVGLVNL